MLDTMMSNDLTGDQNATQVPATDENVVTPAESTEVSPQTEAPAEVPQTEVPAETPAETSTETQA